MPRTLKTGPLPEHLVCATFSTYEEQRDYYAMYRMARREHRRLLNQAWIRNNSDRYKATKWRYRDAIKYKILSYYSESETPICKRCDFTDIDCLVLDHINDDGAEHRRQIGVNTRAEAIAKGGTRMYEAIYRLEDYPDGLQVLCANCNTKKQIQRVKAHRVDNEHYVSEIVYANTDDTV